MQASVLIRDLYAARRAAGRSVVSFEFRDYLAVQGIHVPLAPGIHFYTLNRVRSTRRILQNLGLT